MTKCKRIILFSQHPFIANPFSEALLVGVFQQGQGVFAAGVKEASRTWATLTVGC